MNSKTSVLRKVVSNMIVVLVTSFEDEFLLDSECHSSKGSSFKPNNSESWAEIGAYESSYECSSIRSYSHIESALLGDIDGIYDVDRLLRSLPTLGIYIRGKKTYCPCQDALQQCQYKGCQVSCHQISTRSDPYMAWERAFGAMIGELGRNLQSNLA